jgi:S-adenosylmethionine:tRNA ribosyltransferase-isomerase
MRVDLFDFDLPPERIALRPAVPRDAARLLVVPPDGDFRDCLFNELPGLLDAGDLLVFNDTKVIPAQLEGFRERNGGKVRVGVTLHQRIKDDRWKAFVRPAKRIRPGDRIEFGNGSNACLLGKLNATVAEKGDDGEITLAFDMSGPVLDEAIATVGNVPLPPYISSRRPEDDRDRADYQTVYAKNDGAVAAPTAGLHFTPDLISKLEERGINHCFVTLHVGAGTFLPVKADDTTDHKMHAETGYVGVQAAEKIAAAKASGARVICVGTTSLRLLESAARKTGKVTEWAGATDIFITPGFDFHVADGLITNFHLPRSTLFMLVSAFAGLERMKAAYAHAIESGYRFYSYGDGSLLWKAK